MSPEGTLQINQPDGTPDPNAYPIPLGCLGISPSVLANTQGSNAVPNCLPQ
jgi:hypothetical protein